MDITNFPELTDIHVRYLYALFKTFLNESIAIIFFYLKKKIFSIFFADFALSSFGLASLHFLATIGRLL